MLKLVAVVATALCFTSLLSFAFAAKDPKTVEGLVYCDSCCVKYKAELSDYIAGATVALECKESEGGEVVYSREVVSDQSGTYKVPIEGCHAKLCQVRLVKSPNPECSEIVADGLSSARIDLTRSVGSDLELIRYANVVADGLSSARIDLTRSVGSDLELIRYANVVADGLSSARIDLTRSVGSDLELIRYANVVADGLSSARIDLTRSVGSDLELIRYANDLGFMKKESLPECAKVLEEMFIHG